ncbi:MAG: hypothetical protein LBG09_01840 [Puniceicoccales bacterium]|jgi:hypothetical protein|nr:hypothetical protein [Puniceicoccales bacterium]
MNEKEKKVVAQMVEESQKTFDAMRKVFEETPDLPEEIRKKALKEIKKTEKQVIKLTAPKLKSQG